MLVFTCAASMLLGGLICIAVRDRMDQLEAGLYSDEPALAVVAGVGLAMFSVPMLVLSVWLWV